MIILADENMDHRIIKAIEGIGIEVQSVYFSSRGISDTEVIAWAKTPPPKVILTEDKDFGKLVFRNYMQDLSVIFLCYPYNETAAIIENILRLLQYQQEYVFGHFTTVTINKIRQERYNWHFSPSDKFLLS